MAEMQILQEQKSAYILCLTSLLRIPATAMYLHPVGKKKPPGMLGGLKREAL